MCNKHVQVCVVFSQGRSVALEDQDACVCLSSALTDSLRWFGCSEPIYHWKKTHALPRVHLSSTAFFPYYFTELCASFQIPWSHRPLLIKLCDYLGTCMNEHYAAVNQMTLANVAHLIGPAILRPKHSTSPAVRPLFVTYMNIYSLTYM